MALSSCYRLNSNRVEADIKADIERQGRRVSLKSVSCPGGIGKQAGAYFRCVGELPSGEMFTIHVTQQDDQGTLDWQVPSSDVLINLVSLEDKIQRTFSRELGQRAEIDCGAAYRISESGSAFECDVVGGVTLGTDRVNSVLVKVEAAGDLTWQEVRQPIGTAAAGASDSAATASDAQRQFTQPAAQSAAEPSSPRDPAVIEAELPDVTDD
ncbi:MAG: DUF4333 domain-containing protein [Leptolyngbya sp. SIO4C1]|nr:DUF4333 domain-containing protein [Leptolyngbya sp. SIO4C1]